MVLFLLAVADVNAPRRRGLRLVWEVWRHDESSSVTACSVGGCLEGSDDDLTASVVMTNI